ncbi:MAG: 50S ribosomal protein L9 [Deltaproteobacteria bacterium]|nr:50S ribosomal protein L9 [Deltaproteobacteria bacterium]MBW2019221.1 50S ribosomal protein L9 [Deltaproteobacteria bacterium]MBW2074027.1 50S ribosomal protein L9 [Deltaproteobacteria bacterium]RLB80386.1 MAG: 50S ribosomal protein L9 [Deltaproteobacteria bacterium]
MKVILTETIESLGTVGEEVNVAKGYARNYLIPQKKAVSATPANRKMIERQRAEFEQKLAAERTRAEAMAKTIHGAACTIVAKVSEGDKLYGSVSTRDIAEQLKAQGFDVDKRMVMLSEPIKTLGSYIVPIRLSSDISPEITVKVVPEQEA